MSEQENNIFSTARLTFLSKIKKETIQKHDQYRCLAIQPVFIRILEAIVFSNINKKQIQDCQFGNYAGFTKEKSTATHI